MNERQARAPRSGAIIVIIWVLQLITAAMFLLAGGSKLAGALPMVQMYEAIGWGQWFRYVTGIIEVGSAILLLVPTTAVLGALALMCTMIGAIIAHVTVLHTPPTGPVVLLCLSGAIAWMRRSPLSSSPA